MLHLPNSLSGKCYISIINFLKKIRALRCCVSCVFVFVGGLRCDSLALFRCFVSVLSILLVSVSIVDGVLCISVVGYFFFCFAFLLKRYALSLLFPGIIFQYPLETFSIILDSFPIEVSRYVWRRSLFCVVA